MRTPRRMLAPGDLTDAALAPDGTTVALGSQSSAVAFRDLATGGEVGLLADDGKLQAVASSPDGALFAAAGGTASGVAIVRLWSTATWSKLWERSLAGVSACQVAFSPDGSMVAVGDQGSAEYHGYATVWDTAAGAQVMTTADIGAVRFVAFFPDNTRLLVAGYSGTRVLTVPGNTELVSLPSCPVAALAPDGTAIAASCSSGGVSLYDAATGATVRNLHFWGARTLAFAPDGTSLLLGSTRSSSSWGDLGLLVDPATGAELASLSLHEPSADLPPTFRRVGFLPDSATAFVAASVSQLDGGVTVRKTGGVALFDVAAAWPEQVFTGHTADVTSVSYSSDGARVVTGGKDATARVFSRATGAELLAVPTGTGSSACPAALSPDGTLLLTAGASSTATLYDASTGALVRTFTGHTAALNSVAFSPDGGRIVTGSADRKVKVWNTGGGQVVSISACNSNLCSAVFSPDGSRVLVASMQVRAYNAATGALLQTYRDTPGYPSSQAVYSGDGRLVGIATSSADPAVVLDAATGATVRNLDTGGGVVTIALSADGALAAAGTGTIERVFEVASGRQLHGSERIYGLTALAFSPAGDELLAGHYRNVRAVAVDAPDPLLRGDQWEVQVSNLYSSYDKVAISPDGRWAATVQLKTAILWDLVTGAPLRSFVGHTGNVLAVAISPDGTRLLTGSTDTTAILWDLDAATPLHTLSGHTGEVRCVAFSPDGLLAATGSADATARTWDVTYGTHVATMAGHGASILRVSFAPDGAQVLTAADDSSSRTFAATTGAPGLTLATPGSAAACFSPDGSRILTGHQGSGQYWLREWDAATGVPLNDVPLGTTAGNPNALTYAPDGVHALVGLQFAPGDARLQLWDLAAHTLRRGFAGHGSYGVGALALSADGALVLSAPTDSYEHALLWATGLEPVERSARPIALAEVVTGSVRHLGWADFSLDLAPGAAANLVVEVERTGGAGELRLLGRRGGLPGLALYDWQGRERPDGRLELLVANPPPGPLYLSVWSADWAHGGTSAFQLEAQAVGRYLAAVTPDEGGSAGSVTCQVEGLGFEPGVVVQLRQGAAVLRSAAPFSASGQLLGVTLPLGGLAAQTADLAVVWPDLGEAVLPGAFTVVAGGAALLDAELVIPDQARDSRPYTMVLQYENVGTVDMPAPLLVVTSDENLAMRLDPRAPWVRGPVQVLAVDRVTPGAAGTLSPGRRHSVPISFVAEGANGQQLGFAISVLGSGGAATAVDWDAQEAGFRPDGVVDDAWDRMWPLLTSEVGATWGDYHATLVEAADHLAGLGRFVHDPAALLGLVWGHVLGVKDLGSQAMALDASCPAPGLPLAFARSYPASLTSRLRVGPFGRGWTDLYFDVRASVDGSGAVDLVSNGGSVRRFLRRADGSYVANPGDGGRLVVAGGLYRLVEADGTVLAFAATGELAAISDRFGNSLTLGYDGEGRLETVSHSSGDALTLSHDPVTGRVSQLEDPAGSITTYAYDPAGEHLLEVIAPGNRVTTYAYNGVTGSPADHALTSITHPDGSHTFFQYDGLGRPAGVSRDGGAEPVTWTYPALGHTTTSLASGAVATTLRDEYGRPGATLWADGTASTLAWDGDGHVTRVENGAGALTDTVHGPLGHPLWTTYASGARTTLGFLYPPSGGAMLGLLADPLERVTTFDYDGASSLVSVTYPDASHEDFAADAGGQMVQYTNRRGQLFELTRNLRGQVEEVTLDSGPWASFTYEPGSGALATAANAAGTIAIQHDGRGFAERLTQASGRFSDLTWNDRGRLLLRTDSDGFAVGRVWDPAGRLAQVTDGATTVWVTYSYDSDGRLAREDRGNGTAVAYAYDAVGRIAEIRHLGPGDVLQASFAATYDTAGNVATVTTLEGVTTYAYDVLDRLTRVDRPDGSHVAYSYDAAGNRSAVDDNGVVTDYEVDSLNQYTAVGAESPSWDADGNLTGFAGAALSWDAEGRLVGLSAGGHAWSFTYDALGHRLTETVDGVTTRLEHDSQGLAARLDAGGAVTDRFVWGHGPVLRLDAGGNPTFLGFDLAGNLCQATDAAGAVTDTAAFDPFGRVRSATGATPIPFRFAGRFGVTGGSHGLLAMGARWYHPDLGRFLSPDPLRHLAGFNLYPYASNNPLRWVDPSGLGDWGSHMITSFTGMIGVVEGAVAEVGGFFGGSISSICNLAEIRDGIEKGDWRAISHGAGSMVVNVAGTVLAVGFLAEATVVIGGATILLSDIVAALGIIAFADDAFTDLYIEGLRPSGDHWDDPVPRNAYVTWAKDYPDGNVPPAHLELWRQHHGKPSILRPQDPNEKYGPVGEGVSHTIAPDGAITYTVQFENMPTASAPAQEVVVTDQLDPDLDWSTLRFGEMAWGDQSVTVTGDGPSFSTRVTIGDYRPEVPTSWWLDLAAQVGPAGEVAWLYRTLDPATGDYPADPEAGFLPPNDASGRGEGHLTFTVYPRAGLADGTEITNQASIVFDTNDPITTNQVANTIGYPLCDPSGDGAMDAADLAEEVRALTLAGYLPPGEPDCSHSGGTTGDDLEWMVGRLFR